MYNTIPTKKGGIIIPINPKFAYISPQNIVGIDPILFIILSIIVLLQEQSLSEDLSTYYLGAYFIFVIGFSFLINILMVSGMIPVVGLPLPFFTKGGSSLLCFSIMLGFIFSSRGFLRS